MTAKRVVAYIRVSTEEQAREGTSIESQREVLRSYADRRGLEIVREFVGQESAYHPGRPVFGAMLSSLKGRTDIHGVLFYKIDRIARNLLDYANLEAMENVSIFSATEDLPDNATGKLVATILAGTARLYSEQLSERAKLAQRAKLERGELPTLAPFGYCNDRLRHCVVPDSGRAHLVVELFERYADSELPLSQMVLWARDRGIRTRRGGFFRKSTLHKLLTNPFYYGVIDWRGVLYRGSHQPIISKALFGRVKEKLAASSRPASRRSFPYRGLLQCGYCGCKITAGRHKSYTYYHCTNGRGKCEQPWVRQERLSERLLSIVSALYLTQEEVATLLDLLRRDRSRRRDDCAKRLACLDDEERTISRRRDAAYIDKLDGKITEERWVEVEQMLSRQADCIESQRQRLADRGGPDLDDARACLELLHQAPELYLRQDDEGRARLLRKLVLNCNIWGQTLEPIYRRPFDLVPVGKQTGNWYA